MGSVGNSKVVVLGLGISGRAAARFLLAKGYAVVGVDAKARLIQGDPEIALLTQQGLQLVGEDQPLSLNSIDFLIVSPGIPLNHPLYVQARDRGIETIGEIELASRHLNQPFLGITGTNGKTTVTLLTAHVLNHCGIAARAVGNVGVPLISVVQDTNAREVLVVELSSWQLETMKSAVIDAAVVLNITPDHLDRHESMEAYARAKFEMGRCLKTEGVWFLQDHVARQYRSILESYPRYSTFGYGLEADLRCDQKAVFLNETLEYYLPIGYRGFISHDVENEMAAYSLCRQMGVTAEQFCAASSIFEKPPHRNEFVREHRGVKYFNDSKGTNIDAVIKAVEAMQGGCILIAGGKDKETVFTPLLEGFAGKVRLVCAIGEAAPKIQKQLSPEVPVEIFATLDEAVLRASQEAKQGENVLLSPACASFDMFENYAHRGREFVRCVHSIL